MPGSPEQQALHVLRRLAFGPSRRDWAEVHRLGARAWVEHQLWPERLGDAALERELARLPTVEMSMEALGARYPPLRDQAREGGMGGPFAARTRELGEALGAFIQDLGPRWGEVLVVVMTEFGRTVRENGNRGTDHGTGGAMLVLGGGVRGGRVVGPWKGLAPEHLLEERDVPPLTDYRAVLSEALVGHLGVRSLASIFPGHASGERLGLLRAALTESR